MNRQVDYIFLAGLNLLIAGCVFFFIAKILFTNNKQDSNVVIGTPTTLERALPPIAADGKLLFMSKCAACHNVFRDMTGPSLLGFEERGPWGDRKNVYEWIRDPAGFMKKNEYARNLKEKFGSMMAASPDLSNEQIDAIIAYLTMENNF